MWMSKVYTNSIQWASRFRCFLIHRVIKVHWSTTAANWRKSNYLCEGEHFCGHTCKINNKINPKPWKQQGFARTLPCQTFIMHRKWWHQLCQTRSQKKTKCSTITYFLCILLYTSHPTRTPMAKMSITTVTEIPTVTPEELDRKKSQY